MENLLESLKHWVKLAPGKELVIDGETRYTYAEVYDRAGRLAGGLHRLGAGKGTRVANMMFNSHYYYDLYYGLSAAGCTIVPMNLQLADQELVYQINDSGSKV